MARLDTRLQAQGAEFLVLAQLLMEGIEAYKTYNNYPGYDVMAVNHQSSKTCRIQVKSRYGTRRGFPINNVDTDFVAFVAIRPEGRDNPAVAPEVYLFPIDLVMANRQPHSYGKVLRVEQLEVRESYLGNFEPVLRFLDLEQFQAEGVPNA